VKSELQKVTNSKTLKML